MRPWWWWWMIPYSTNGYLKILRFSPEFFDFVFCQFRPSNPWFCPPVGLFGSVSMPDLDSGARDLQFDTVKLQKYNVSPKIGIFEISIFWDIHLYRMVGVSLIWAIMYTRHFYGREPSLMLEIWLVHLSNVDWDASNSNLGSSNPIRGQNGKKVNKHAIHVFLYGLA